MRRQRLGLFVLNLWHDLIVLMLTAASGQACHMNEM